MFLPNIVFLGCELALSETIKEPIRLIGRGLSPSELEGDVSWHGILREDVFLTYASWLRSVSKKSNVLSNGAVWLALTRGRVTTMEHFVYVKESSFYDCVADVRERERLNLLAAFGNDLSSDNGILNLLGQLSLVLSSEPVHAEPMLFRNVVSILLDRLYNEISVARTRAHIPKVETALPSFVKALGRRAYSAYLHLKSRLLVGNRNRVIKANSASEASRVDAIEKMYSSALEALEGYFGEFAKELCDLYRLPSSIEIGSTGNSETPAPSWQ